MRSILQINFKKRAVRLKNNQGELRTVINRKSLSNLHCEHAFGEKGSCQSFTPTDNYTEVQFDATKMGF